MGSWDLMVKFRAKSNDKANTFFNAILEELIDKEMMKEDKSHAFGKRKLINVIAQSKNISNLNVPMDNEDIVYTLLPSDADYDIFRASRSFIHIDKPKDCNERTRMALLNSLQERINKGRGQKIIESICEGENELIIETLSTCSKSNYINHLNKEIEPALSPYILQKFTLSCYYYDESGLLSNAKAEDI